MADSINLWECLTAAERNHRKHDTGPAVHDDQLTSLGRTARFHQQELSVEATEAGWVIRVFGCGVEQAGDEVVILIPSDVREPVRVQKDRVGQREYHHG